VRPGTDEIAARNRQHVAALCETGNVFEMTAAQTRGDTIHARNLYAAEVRLTGVDEYVLLRPQRFRRRKNLAPLGSGEFREPDRIPE
jgi:hypothetical protein